MKYTLTERSREYAARIFNVEPSFKKKFSEKELVAMAFGMQAGFYDGFIDGKREARRLAKTKNKQIAK